METSEEEVARLFDDMAEEYDQLEDEWYPHLFRRLEQILRAHPPRRAGARVLDVGCGTGLQTRVLRSLGYDAIGIDISEGLLAQARKKVPDARFVRASALALPFANAEFDEVTCLGSVLGFVPDFRVALGQMARVLAKGGRLILEIDHRWNLDLLWALADNLVGGKLGFEQPLRTSLRNLTHAPFEGITQDYPFTKLDGTTENMHVRLFTRTEVLAEARRRGLRCVETHGIHATTNLLPSTWLAHPNLSRRLRQLARLLTRIDERVAPAMFSNNLVLVLEK